MSGTADRAVRGPLVPPAPTPATTPPAPPGTPHPAPAADGPRVRRAGPADLPAVAALEAVCFQPHRRASRASLARSLAQSARWPHGRQSVWVVDDAPADGGRGRSGGRGAGAGPSSRLKAMLVLWRFPRSGRIYDIATHPDHRGQGIADALLRHGEALAREGGADRMVLEADPTEPGLVAWYEKRGYRTTARRRDFYGPGRHAVRMEKPLR